MKKTYGRYVIIVRNSAFVMFVEISVFIVRWPEDASVIFNVKVRKQEILISN